MISTVRLARGAAAAVSAHTRVAGDNETGGILIGAVEDGVLRINFASPPGPEAVHGPFCFRRDTEFAQRYLDRRVRQAVREIDYVGEWHVHRALHTKPSSVDRREMRRIARRDSYATSEPVLLLAEFAADKRRLRAFRFTGARRRERELSVSLE